MARKKQGIIQPEAVPWHRVQTLYEQALGVLSPSEIEKRQISIASTERRRLGFPDSKSGWTRYAVWARQQNVPLAELLVHHESPKQVLRRRMPGLPNEADTRLWAKVEHAKSVHGFTSDMEALMHLLGPVHRKTVSWNGKRHELSSLVKNVSRVRNKFKTWDANQKSTLIEAYRLDTADSPAIPRQS